MTELRRGQPLSLRLALVLSVAVLAVLLVTGLAVNRLVSRSLEQELTAVQRERLAVAAEAFGSVNLRTPRGQHFAEQALQRVAVAIRGRAELVDATGAVLAARGQLPPGVEVERIEEPVPGDAGLTLTLVVPRAEQAFLRVFNATLLIAGVLAVLALIVVAALLSDRLTRPLREVAAAARRLGAGDLAARASGGPDRESAELADAFNSMAARLERSEILRRRAASDMAHDLATPATVLESQLQAMVDGVVPADREQLERARAAAGAMSGVIVQLRELVDVEAARLQRRPTRAMVADLLADAQRALEPLYRERDVVLSVEDAPPSLAVEVDVTQVGRALRNVLTNAAQHAPPGSTVTVEVEAGGAAVRIRVTDAGRGIAADDLPHVFERFYRADPARAGGEARSGSGIGLTIARELLAANGGSIGVERTGPHGTTFAIELPASPG
jgi:two-component system sensor histidine kinase BaeS